MISPRQNGQLARAYSDSGFRRMGSAPGSTVSKNGLDEKCGGPQTAWAIPQHRHTRPPGATQTTAPPMFRSLRDPRRAELMVLGAMPRLPL